ncbi:hypothetical protein [Terriglobus tenax]|uniref:hypothetical protein n=1 Tax=Terriglobus tenax TaxID=1111115 RepID=UPI0021E0EA24|nr:hypothetical protein [Terriglobus tenax]
MVPKFTSGSQIGDSAITESNGNVGIGTAIPSSRLSILAGTLGDTLGSTVPLVDFHNYNPHHNSVSLSQIRTSSVTGWPDGYLWQTATTRFQVSTDVTPQGYMDFNPAGGSYGLAFGSGAAEFLRLDGSGNVGVGTTSPTTKFEVNGNVKLTAGSGASITFPDNSIQSTAWNGTTCGGDYAESVDVEGGSQTYEPGDVLIIDKKIRGHFSRSSEAYSRRVAGIYSTKPGLVGRRQSTPKDSESEVPMAMMGIVPVKVSAENGPIESGDLLVASSTPGYAMKGTEPSKMMGAVIGKAMDSFASGTGVIEVLVSLQ